MQKKTVGMWMYANGGGEEIQRQMVEQLRERDIQTIVGLNLHHAKAKNGGIVCHGVTMEELDLFFSYNAGEQTVHQMYLYQALNDVIPTVNPYRAFELTEDKFRTAYLLNQHDIPTAEFRLCHRSDINTLRNTIQEWGDKVVYKPTDGWGGVGIVKIESERVLDMLLPFVNQTDLRHFYIERYIENDHTDFRIDIVDGEYISCYGRRAPADDWKTNITSGGSVFTREPEDEVIELAKKATEVCGLDIAGVDILYDLEQERYIVLEVNGIPAFATPEQEKLGLNFNQKKIDTIVDLIDRKVTEHHESK
jgi:ribosomal protein S6--L-glutamate ligase